VALEVEAVVGQEEVEEAVIPVEVVEHGVIAIVLLLEEEEDPLMQEPIKITKPV
jgi:hypothetical protein